jgi:membrane-associated phospholipid phosphatase
MDRRGIICLVLFAVVLSVVPGVTTSTANATEGIPSGLEKTGDILQIVLPAAGAGATLLLDDKEGQKMWIYSFVTNIGTVSTIKLTVDKTRPNEGKHSFPSGHTAAAFMGASFIQRRYGWFWGVPSYGLAGVVGYSRVRATKHDIYDVIGGASIGIMSSYIFTKPYRVGDTEVAFAPTISEDYVGLNLAFKEAREPLFDRVFQMSNFAEDLETNDNKNIQISTGTDPTEIRSRFEFWFGAMDQTGAVEPSAREVTATLYTARFDWAFHPSQLVGVDLQWVQNRQDPYNSCGIGDTVVEYRLRWHEDTDARWWEPRAMSTGIDQSFPTGSASKGTGFDAWVVRPKVTGAWTFVRNVNFYPTFSFYCSPYEKSDRSMQMIGLETMVEYKFPNGVYFNWAPEFLWDKHSEEDDTANHYFEIGVPLEKDFYIYGQYALIGNANWVLNPPDTDRPRYYDDLAVIGLRWLF